MAKSTTTEKHSLLLCLFFSVFVGGVWCRPPHVIFIVADDLGFTDVSFHESVIQTPNIDRYFLLLVGSGGCVDGGVESVTSWRCEVG